MTTVMLAQYTYTDAANDDDGERGDTNDDGGSSSWL